MSETSLNSAARQAVADRAHGCCEYCFSQRAYSHDPFEVDHIYPRTLDGSDDEDNPAYACGGCNGHKHARTEALDPLSGRPAPLFHARRDRWHDHFEWSADLTLMIGLTPTGRATITALDTNRFGVVNLRRLLLLIDGHPPGHTKAR